MTRVAVLGASGFVGSAVVAALAGRGVAVRCLPAPRLSGLGTSEQAEALAEQLSGCVAVVNAAGMATATAADQSQMDGANAHLPLLVLHAADIAGARFVHVSSAAVQGRKQPLDSSWDLQPFSPYSRSKAAGELALRSSRLDGWTIYRPGGVHGAERGVTRSIARVARSRALRVPRTPHPTPLTLVGNVASAVAHLATTTSTPPPVVHHPYEGVTTHSVLTALGDGPLRTMPNAAARLALSAASPASRVRGLEAHVRRLELLWFGQEQDASWLTADGWEPQLGEAAWAELGRALTSPSERHDRESR